MQSVYNRARYILLFKRLEIIIIEEYTRMILSCERTEIMSLITHPHDLACIPFSKQHLSFPAKARILLILQH